jgi:hypothetical protein
MRPGPIRKNPVSRFLSSFQCPGQDCWEWNGGMHRKGYGVFWDGSKLRKAHRYSYELFRGAIAIGLTLDHLCRNRKCVNPDHLEPVTNRVNIMRGEGIASRNARKTHCLRGHPLEGKNLLIDSQGYRQCRKCYRAAQNVWQQNKRRNT